MCKKKKKAERRGCGPAYEGGELDIENQIDLELKKRQMQLDQQEENQQLISGNQDVQSKLENGDDTKHI